MKPKETQIMIVRTAILALSIALAGTPALAAPAMDHQTTLVRVGDLNLASTEGRDRLDSRLRNAARRICSTGGRGVTERKMEADCTATALATVKPQVDRVIAQAGGGTQLALLMIQPGR
jgi:UrcA family protein